MTQPSDSLTPVGEFVMFISADDKVRIECRFENVMLWLSQATMAEHA